MTFFLDTGATASALRIGGALASFWERGGRAGEGRALLEPALRMPSSAAPAERARALYAAGKLAYIQDDHEAERRFFAEALELFRRTGDACREVLTEIELAWTALVLGDVEAARAGAELGVDRARDIGDEWVYAYALRLSGAVLSELGEHEEAKLANRKSIALFEACGDSREQMRALSVLGWLAIVSEDYEQAASLLHESIARASTADAEFLAINRSNLGLVKLFLGDDERAIHEFTESLRAQRVAAESLLGLAAVVARGSNVRGAARLRAASVAIHEACGATLNSAEERVEERFLAGLTDAAGDRLDRSISLDQAAKEAAEIVATTRAARDRR